MNTPLRIAIVEDEPATRRRLVESLAADAAFQIVAEFDNGRTALKWLESHSPDVLLCDLGLPDLPGLAVITYCVHRYPRCHVMVITMYEDESHVMRSLKAGAKGYLLKDSLGSEVAERVHELARGGSPITPVIARLVLNTFHAPARAVDAETVSLSPKEITVLTRIAQGFSYVEIASLEGVARSTVATHVRNVYGKLAVHSKNEAVFEASRLGLIDTQF